MKQNKWPSNWPSMTLMGWCVVKPKLIIIVCRLRLPRLGKRELILVLFVRLFGLCLFRFVGFLFLLGSGKGCGLWLWHSLDFSLTFFDTRTQGTHKQGQDGLDHRHGWSGANHLKQMLLIRESSFSLRTNLSRTKLSIVSDASGKK